MSTMSSWFKSVIRNRLAESFLAKTISTGPYFTHGDYRKVNPTVSGKPSIKPLLGDIRQAGIGYKKIEGSIKGNVPQNGCGSLHIHGDVTEAFSNSQMCSGTLNIDGNVQGKTFQNVSGHPFVKMGIYGDISRMVVEHSEFMEMLKAKYSSLDTGDIRISYL